MTASNVITPTDVRELEACVQEANARGIALQVVGGESKRSVGRPGRVTANVSTARFAAIIDYDPAELVLTVGAGAKLRDVEALLEANGQMLAFEPINWGDSTIGGVVAAGFAGSRRVSAGNVRDHVLGVSAVSGRGERFVAGGRVVKNVTGYDLPKLLCGSWGQLAIATEITLKVLPRPRTSLTLWVRGLDAESASKTMLLALRSQADVSGAAFIPAGADNESQTLLRLEGFGPSVDARAEMLRESLPQSFERVNEAADVWAKLRSAWLLERDSNAAMWRICIPATRCASMLTAIREWRGSGIADWGGGLIWANLTTSIAGAHIRACVEQLGGHATLVAAPDEYRNEVPALHPETAAVSRLSERVRAAFDPARVLDPRRFHA